MQGHVCAICWAAFLKSVLALSMLFHVDIDGGDENSAVTSCANCAAREFVSNSVSRECVCKIFVWEVWNVKNSDLVMLEDILFLWGWSGR